MREEDCVHTAPSHVKQRTDAGLVSSLVAEDQLQGSSWQLLGPAVPVGVTAVSQWHFLQHSTIHWWHFLLQESLRETLSW